VFRAVLTAAALTAAVWCGCAEAKASPVCEHRSAEHAAQHHMSREADSRYHVMHGERPTCGLDDDKDKSNDEHHDEDHSIPRRDHPGFHCTWRGCG